MKRLIYLIDNDDIFSYGMKKMINKHQLADNVQCFSTGISGLDHLNQLNEIHELPKYILLDLNMPVMDGWEFIQEFRKLPDLKKNHMSIFILSSSINPADIERSETFPEISGYLVKPITIELLSAKICF